MRAQDNSPRVLFDVMDTLVVDPFFTGFADFLGMEFQELVGQLHPTTWVEFERGELDEETAQRRFFADGRAMDWEGLKRWLKSEYRFIAGMEELLGELKDLGVEMHVLSNYPAWHTMIEEKLVLSRYLEWSFVSCEMGVRKPSAEIYRRATHALNVAPERCLLVDNQRKNCEGAEAVGMRSIHFTDAASLRQTLADYGVPLSLRQS